MSSTRRLGTSLVEVLVVIVVFLIGILAIVQIFPGGFKALGTSARMTTAAGLARAMSENLKARADQLPDAIIPVKYTFTGSTILIEAQPDHFPSNLGPDYGSLDQNGTLYDAGNVPIGNWQYLTGSAITRRVLGEGKVIPTPRLIGSQYGSLLSLQFAPLVFNPAYTSLFVVYGNDLNRHEGDPTQSFGRTRPYDFYVDNEDNSSAAIYLPEISGKAVSYTIDVTVYDSTSGERRDFINVPVTVGVGPGWYQQDVQALVGTSITGIEYESVRVRRQFDLVPTANAFSPDPYEYKLLSAQLGLVLFNPVGYNFTIRRSNGRRDPLVGRVSYDVYDWRIIHDEFRVPETSPPQYRLAVGSLKVAGEQGPDGMQNQGIGVQAPDSTGAYKNADLVLQDVDTGALFVFEEGTIDPTRTSFVVNKSIGLVTLLDYDSDPSNGVQLRMVYPGDTTPVTVTVTNRTLRALYMGKNEWAVQVLKPAARYSETWTRPGIGEFYIGQSSLYGGAGNRIYFPPADAGRIVSVGELYYTNTSGQPVGPVQLTAPLQTNDMDLGVPYIQVSDFYPDFGAFDYSYGTSVKSVKGASVAVRVLWNPDDFRLLADTTTNMDALEKWMQGWRRSTVETYLQRGF